MNRLPFELCLCAIGWLLYNPFPFSSIFGTTGAFVILSSYTAYSRQFELGTQYSFSYSSWVTLNEPQQEFEPSPKDVGFKIDLDVGLVPIWQHPSNIDEQLLELKISAPKLSVKARIAPTPSAFVPKLSKADYLQSYAFYLHREGGKIKKIFRADEDTLSAVNIKKGISSLFQYKTETSFLAEIDSSGLCDVSYVHESRGRFVKTKTNCQPLDFVPFYNHTSTVLGAAISNYARSSFTLSDEDTSLSLAESWETHTLGAQLRPEKGIVIIARQILNRTSTSPSVSKTYSGNVVLDVIGGLMSELRQSLVGEELAVTPPPSECAGHCKALGELIDMYRPSLTSRNMATQSACIAFLKLLHKVRESSREEIKAVLTEKRNANILPQLIDVVGATQTVQAHQAAKDVLRFTSPIELPERYLNALALNTHPLESVMEDLLAMLNKGIREQKVHDSMVLTVSSMANTFSKNKRNKNNKLVTTVLSYLTNELEMARTQQHQMTMLRGMQNLASKNSMETLLSYARVSEPDQSKVAIQAMRALQTMPDDYFTKRMLKQLERVLFQLDTPHDSSVRVMAFDILLRDDPSERLIRDVFHMIKRSDDKEINTLLLGMAKEAAFKNDTIKKRIADLLAECHLDSYYTESQLGLSSAISRQLSDRSSPTDLSFSNQLEINGGLLKRSTVDVYLKSNENPTSNFNQSTENGDKNVVKEEREQNVANRLNLLNFGIFAGGLSMFGGEDAADDGQEANAGIEISVLGAGLRPIVFFTGQGELMGHVWSGTGSERTSALQGSILLQDHSQIIALQNGLTAEMILNGVISIDFAGAVQISLWNRNAQSLVEVEAASVVQGQVRVANSFVRTSMEFNYGAQSELDFITNLDFYSEIMMCLQMVQQDLSLVDSVRKSESIHGSSYKLRKYKRKSYPMPGKTYAMNKKNTEFCNKMFR